MLPSLRNVYQVAKIGDKLAHDCKVGEVRIYDAKGNLKEVIENPGHYYDKMKGKQKWNGAKKGE